MPSSLVVTALIVAWLAVLVPVVARRRQLVPRPAEADLCSRVLPRSGGPASMEAAVSGTTSSPRTSSASRGAGASSASRGAGGSTAVADRHEPAVEDFDDDAAVADGDDERFDGLDEDDVDDFDDGYDARDDLAAGHDAGGPDDPDGRGSTPRREYRPGRGGFDPDAALAAADARYAFRRRVALGLLVVAVVSALAALVISPVLWWVHVLVDLALIGYLVFLRRQTRLEEDVRERRLARMRGDRRMLEARRAERAEHERRLAEVDDWGAWEGDGDVTGPREDSDEDLDDVDGLSDDELLEIDEPEDDGVVVAADSRRSRHSGSRQARRGGLPEGLELVEDTDDDPAFHDLDADRVPAYRRAAGA